MPILRHTADTHSLDGNISPGAHPCLTEIPWYVIQSCCHHEARVEERLLKLGLEAFLPRHTVLSRRRDRKKLLQVPLFPGYLFVRDFLEPATYL